MGGSILLLFFLMNFIYLIEKLNPLKMITNHRRLTNEAINLNNAISIGLAGALLLIIFVIPWSGTRIFLLFPLISIGLPVISDAINGKIISTQVKVLLFFFIFQIISICFYFYKLPKEWEQRNPHRYDKIVDSTSSAGSILAPPELWFAFLEKNIRITLIYPYIGESQIFINDPSLMSDYDIVILKQGLGEYNNFKKNALVKHNLDRIYNIGDEQFIIFKKNTH